MCFSPLSLKKNEVGLYDLRAVCMASPISSRFPELVFMKLGMYIVTPEPVSTAYFINPSHQSVCLHVYPRVTSLVESMSPAPLPRAQWSCHGSEAIATPLISFIHEISERA
jgi:hypothetical protein